MYIYNAVQEGIFLLYKNWSMIILTVRRATHGQTHAHAQTHNTHKHQKQEYYITTMTRQKIKWVFEWVFGLAINFIRDVPERKKLTSSCKYCWHFYERQFFLPSSGQLFIFEKFVLECEAFLLSLLPLFKIKINISSLKRGGLRWYYNIHSGLTISYSSVMAFGSSCLWNHIMYFVWNLHDCFFSAFAAKYCAFVP